MIAYIKHPLNKAKRDEYVAQGYKVIDMRFKPDELGAKDIVVDVEKPKRRRTKKTKQE